MRKFLFKKKTTNNSNCRQVESMKIMTMMYNMYLFTQGKKQNKHPPPKKKTTKKPQTKNKTKVKSVIMDT